MACTIQGHKVIVVGGGLAGLSAAHSVLERGGRCLVLDKMDFLGGNSVKATSGINGALTRQQIALGIPDTVESFAQDTAVGGKMPNVTPLARVLVYNSAPAVEWLVEKFGLDLSLISRLGGHSHPRTHRGKERFPGMTITYALMEKFEAIAEAQPTLAQVITKARVTKLLTDKSGAVIGVEYECGGKTLQEHGPVVISTGGFAADFSDTGLLKSVRPDLMHLPTTNGEHCTGDGLKMSIAVGGSTIDMKAVQVHPTGLVHPDDPNSKVKWLAAEALRGVGGLLLDANGKRFCNELGTRDYVTGEMWKNKGPFRLVLNGGGTKEIEWHCKHYCGRGLMKHFTSGAALAKDMGIPASTLKQTLDSYNKVAQEQKDPFGKKYFQNLPFSMDDDNYHVAIVTPVVHYCMGGLQIDPEARIVNSNGKPIPGLHAAGECAGGVHGQNRLGGSGLLGCVVYGRVAGDSAARYLFDSLSTSGALVQSGPIGATISHGGVSTRVEVNHQNKQLTITVGYEGETKTVSASAPQAAAAQPAKKEEKKAVSTKTITMEEVAKHKTDKDCWVVINGQVLNATPFLDKHPGGKAAIMLYAGKDASAEFNMIHKPDVIAKYTPDLILGNVAGSEKLHSKL